MRLVVLSKENKPITNYVDAQMWTSPSGKLTFFEKLKKKALGHAPGQKDLTAKPWQAVEANEEQG